MSEYKIYGINGPVVTVKGKTDLQMTETVYVGEKQLIGEVIGLSENHATIQVYEETAGLTPGEPVFSSRSPMSVTLGPGIMSNIFDGIERPLESVREISGAFIEKGINIPAVSETKKWTVTVALHEGDKVFGGEILASCPETDSITHKSLVPPNIKGTVTKIVPNGEYTVTDTIAEITDSDGKIHEIKLAQRWPIRVPRPVKERLPLSKPLITGQRIIDTIFPIAKGGAAAIPGGFGTGKTMTQHQLAKWCDADIIIYIGCGERGNEMTQVLSEFSELTDPRTGKSLLSRTVLIANTSNMPVAAREASIYTGITLAEYYRDMGYHTAIMADSTSRWAEALREISGRLEEMPADEGFPAYLPSRLSEFYERSGYFENLNGTEGSVTIIGAVSPQGSDFSEPVTQNTKRFTRCFWALDKSLAYARHYPAINWTTSYSEYTNELSDWYKDNVDPMFTSYRDRLTAILSEEANLMEIVKLIGADVLPDDQKLIIEIARVIRVGFLQQNAFHSDDTFVPAEKQMKMMQAILHLYDRSKEVVARQIPISKITATGLFDRLIKMKYDIPNKNIYMLDMFKALNNDIDSAINDILR